MNDNEMTDFLSDAVGVVEANSYELHMLWAENQRRAQPRTWKENPRGLLETVGHIADRPVCIGLFTAEVDQHKLLFIDATSQVVDHRMIDKWLTDTLPQSAFRKDGHVNKTNAMNFHNVFPITP